MNEESYYIVEASVLPEIFLKVVEAKRYLEIGEEHTIHSATQRAGISRSAFYKYKDAIRPFRDMGRGRIITLQILLRDEPGALSEILDLMANHGGNILTINQSIPSGGAAAVTVGMMFMKPEIDLEELLNVLKSNKLVIHCEVLAG